MNPGKLCVVDRGAPLFPESWKRGQQPINIDATTTGIILYSKQDDTHQPRTFFYVSTCFGTGWVNSHFCRKKMNKKPEPGDLVFYNERADFGSCIIWKKQIGVYVGRIKKLTLPPRINIISSDGNLVRTSNYVRVEDVYPSHEE